MKQKLGQQTAHNGRPSTETTMFHAALGPQRTEHPVAHGPFRQFFLFSFLATSLLFPQFS